MRDGEGTGEPCGNRGAGHRPRGQRPVGRERAQVPGHHPPHCGDEPGRRRIRVHQDDGQHGCDRRVHAEHPHARHRGGLHGGLARMQQHHQLVQDQLTGGERGDRADEAAPTLGHRHEHGRQQREQHHEQREIGHGAAARDVPDCGEQRAQHGQRRAAQRTARARSTAAHGYGR
jgi:hypothetical protein